MIVPYGPDPVAAALHLGIECSFVTHSDHYDVTLPDGVDEAAFTAALAVEASEIYRVKRLNERLAELADMRWQATQWFTYDGVTAPADAALTAVTGYVVAAQIRPPSGPDRWKLAAGEFRMWSVADIVDYGIAIRAHVQACFDREDELSAALAAAPDIAALDAIDLTIEV